MQVIVIFGMTFGWVQHPKIIISKALPSCNIPKCKCGFIWIFEGNQLVWTFMWKRGLRPRDCVEKSQLDKMLINLCLSYEGGDKVTWVYNSSSAFTSKSFSYELDKLSPIPHNDAIKGVWKGRVSHRIEVFVWTVLMEKLSTRQKLAQIGIIRVSSNLFPMCSLSPEHSNHLLLHCPFPHHQWSSWIGLWNVKCVFPCSLKDAFVQWCTPKRGSFFKKVWLSCFFYHCMVYLERA